MIDLQNFCDYAGEDFKQRKIIEGHRVFNTKSNIFDCGLRESSDDDNLKVSSKCLKTSQLRDGFHSINGTIKNTGKIIKFICSCPAGESGQCKHIIGTLFYCLYKDVKPISCTDEPCVWDKKYKEAVEDYKAVPLEDHPCFSDSPPTNCADLRNLQKVVNQKSTKNLKDTTVLGNSQIINSNLNTVNSKSKNIKRVMRANELSEDMKSAIRQIFSTIETAAIIIASKGRHGPLKVKEISVVTSDDQKIYKLIFENQDSDLSENISLFKVKPILDCCLNVLQSLNGDGLLICVNTRNWFAEWLLQRKYRVTGTTCYGLFTYINNKNPDWKTKCDKFIEPKAFKTEATQYGNKFENQARNVFKADYPNLHVVEAGLVISQVNPWMAFSPDGVIVKDGKLTGLLEIKCPVHGKSNSINDVVDNIIKGKHSFLIQEGENTCMNKNHKYYGQVQMGMLILNVQTCYFVIHSSFDKKNYTLRVLIDESFLTNMFHNLKQMYFSVMLPEICCRMNPKESPHQDGSHLDFKIEKEKKVKKVKCIKNLFKTEMS